MALDYLSLGTRITELRKKSGITQLQFAELIDKSTTFVSRLERGKKGISLETLLLIATVLETTPNNLLENSIQAMKDEHELMDYSPYERYVLTHTMNALQKILREGKHIQEHND